MAERRSGDGTTACVRAGLSRRAREIRLELYGEGGAAVLAEAIGVPVATWLNFEAGVAVPAEVVLRFLDATAASPRWLLDGRGDRYLVGRYDAAPFGPN